MKKHIIIGFILGCSLLFTACASAEKEISDPDSPSPASTNEEAKSLYQSITAEEAKEMMDAGSVTIVDVRTEEEYSEAHIPGSVLIPNETIGSEPPAQLPDKDATLLVYCRSGNRSKQASGKLAEQGYTNVYEFGGITDWPYETEGGQSE